MSLVLSSVRAVFITAVGGGTVYGSVKAGVWSTDGNKSVETLREVKLPADLVFQRDTQVNAKQQLTTTTCICLILSYVMLKG